MRRLAFSVRDTEQQGLNALAHAANVSGACRLYRGKPMLTIGLLAGNYDLNKI